MGMYGRVAVAAAQTLAENPELPLGTGWYEALARETQSVWSRRLGGPRSAFYMLCYGGWVRGVNYEARFEVPTDHWAFQLAELGIAEPRLPQLEAWRRVAPGHSYQGQADVVFALRDAGLLVVQCRKVV